MAKTVRTVSASGSMRPVTSMGVPLTRAVSVGAKGVSLEGRSGALKSTSLMVWEMSTGPSRRMMVPPRRSRSLRANSGTPGASGAAAASGRSFEKEKAPLPR